MQLRDRRGHLCYCTNIHPGETWDEVRRNLERYLPAVKRAVAPGAPFGVGLRLSAAAARELEEPSAFGALQDLLAREGLYVFTLNGFPYGAFHGAPVKEDVYLPDWRDEARLSYTDRLAGILARLLPEGIRGTISTVPGAYRANVRSDEDARRMGELMVRHAITLHRIHETTGRRIALALEPEPCCYLETSHDVVAFFERELRSERAVACFARECGLTRSRASGLLAEYLTVCVDACHLAVEFEGARDALERLARAEIRVGKVQVSCGLEVELTGEHAPDASTLSALERFADAVYLHQVVERTASGLRRFTDLPDAIADARAAPRAATWRVHFHVPVFEERLPGFKSTQGALVELLAALQGRPELPHLEVETYTWDVLPEELRNRDVSDAIATELRWTLERLG